MHELRAVRLGNVEGAAASVGAVTIRHQHRVGDLHAPRLDVLGEVLRQPPDEDTPVATPPTHVYT